MLRIREDTIVHTEADLTLDDYHTFLEIAQGKDVFFIQVFMNHSNGYHEAIGLLAVNGNNIAYVKEFPMFMVHIDTLLSDYSIWDDPIFIDV